METIYVLDTSVLLHAGKSALSNFGKNTVILPMGVIKTLESYAKDNEFGWIARSVLQEIENLRTQNATHDIHKAGVQVNKDAGLLRVEANHRTPHKDFPASAQEQSNTLLVAFNLQQESPNEKVVLVSNNLTQRIFASVLQLESVVYRRASSQGDYEGITSLTVNAPNVISRIYEEGSVPLTSIPETSKYPDNHGFVLTDGRSSVLTVKSNDRLVKCSEQQINHNVVGRSAEQRFAIHHLMNPDVDIVSLSGVAGTGKTLLALAAGYKQVRSGESYKKLLVFRPLHEVGKQEIGFLPGTEEEKMEPWTQAVKDALEVFLEPNVIRKSMESGEIEVAPTSFIRGRTISNAFIVIDEAQNFERLTLLSILSRLGEGSKCVLSWDAAQRDNLHINKDDGVVSVVDRLKDEDIVAHVTLKKSERSRAAKIVTEVLDELDY